ncbi:hypothetical protein D3C71_1496700 [compost metagenome]
MCITSDMLVLVDDALFTVNYNENHISPFNRTHRTHNTVFLNVLIYLTFFAHTCSIDKHITLSITFKRRINSIASSTCNITNDNAFFTQNCVNQRGFTYIRTANQSYTNHIFIVFIIYFLWQTFYDSVQ